MTRAALIITDAHRVAYQEPRTAWREVDTSGQLLADLRRMMDSLVHQAEVLRALRRHERETEWLASYDRVRALLPKENHDE